MTYYELTPAYGQDYRSAKDAHAGWEAGNDWVGDYALGFQYVNKDDIPKPCTVNLRYSHNTKVVPVKVSA